jgi:hypothetical protein
MTDPLIFAKAIVIATINADFLALAADLPQGGVLSGNR